MNPKIIYKENPLESQVILNEDEKRELFLRLKIWCLEDNIMDIEMCLERNPPDVAKALEYCRMENYGEEEAKDMMDRWVFDSLQESHAGDCTCFPATCSKCFTEDLLGICTIPGLRKHEAHNIYACFSGNPGITIDEVIIKMDDGISEQLATQYPDSIERWRQEKINAKKWLIEYKEKHL